MTLSQVTLDTLRGAARSDTSLDIFHVAVPETIERVRHRLAPFVMDGAGERLLWGFVPLRHLSGEPADAEYPSIRLGGDSAAELSAALRAEGRTDLYTWRERAAITTCAEKRGMELGADLLALVQSDGDMRTAVGRFKALPAYLSNAVDAGTIDIRTAEVCVERDRDAIETILNGMAALSFSKRTRMIRWFCEYAAGNGLDEATQRERAREVVAADDAETALRMLRYPALTVLDQRVALFRDRYCRGTGVRIEPPPSYEGDEIRVSFAFRSTREYEARLEALARAREGIDEVLGVLF